jgi:hypothetical protein
MDQQQETKTIIRGLCSDCPYWMDLAGYTPAGDIVHPGEAGACRAQAPKHVQELDPASVPDTLVSGLRPGIWPMTRGDDWCGQHPLRSVLASNMALDLIKRLKETGL